MAESPSLIAYKVVFCALGCFMLATIVYTTVTDGSPFRVELLTPWMIATLIDFYVNVVAIAVWVVYKESAGIKALIWVVLLVCFGSVATCAYITLKLFTISSQGPKISLRQLLLREDHECLAKCSSIVLGRVVFSTLGIFVLTVVVYTVATDGLPFRMDLLTPWMAATLIDFYINALAISVWVVHKEPTWISAFIWICLLICFGSITTCAYITIQLFRLSLQEPMYKVLLNTQDSHGSTSSK